MVVSSSEEAGFVSASEVANSLQSLFGGIKEEQTQTPVQRKAVLLDGKLMKRNVHLIPGRVEEGPAHIKFEDLRVFVGSKEVARLEDLVARVSLRGIELRALCGGRTAEGILSLRGNLYLKTRDLGTLRLSRRWVRICFSKERSSGEGSP